MIGNDLSPKLLFELANLRQQLKVERATVERLNNELRNQADKWSSAASTYDQQLEAEERDHSQTVEERDHHEENINQIAAELGLECEWSNLCDVGHECIGAATYLRQQLEAERGKVAEAIGILSTHSISVSRMDAVERLTVAISRINQALAALEAPEVKPNGRG